MPRVSVVIPSYNHAPYIGKAIQSVLIQTEKDLELIVVDDGSTDNSLEIIRNFTDPRIHVYPQSNCGAHAAINRGLGLATSDYLSILNSDDQYMPTRLQKLVAVLESNPAIGLCGSYIEVVDEKDRLLGVKHGYHDLEPWALRKPEKSFRATDDLHAVLMTENYWSTTSNYVFTRKWYSRIGAFRPLRYAHDWDFALRISLEAGLHLQEEPLMKYRLHAGNTIRENQAAMIFEICWILAVHLPRQTQAAWFQDYPKAERAERLLHSIHTFNMDRVLSALMALNLSENEGLSLELLNPKDPTRNAYIDWIFEILQEQNQAPQSSAADTRISQDVGLLGKAVRKLNQIIH